MSMQIGFGANNEDDELLRTIAFEFYEDWWNRDQISRKEHGWPKSAIPSNQPRMSSKVDEFVIS